MTKKIEKKPKNSEVVEKNTPKMQKEKSTKKVVKQIENDVEIKDKEKVVKQSRETNVDIATKYVKTKMSSKKDSVALEGNGHHYTKAEMEKKRQDYLIVHDEDFFDLVCPDDLTKGAAHLWKFYADMSKRVSKFENLNILDTHILKQYCITCDIYNKLYAEFKKSGEQVYIKQGVYSKDGELIDEKDIINPLFKEMRDMGTQMSKLATLLGFEPSARRKATGGKKETIINATELLEQDMFG